MPRGAAAGRRFATIQGSRCRSPSAASLSRQEPLEVSQAGELRNNATGSGGLSRRERGSSGGPGGAAVANQGSWWPSVPIALATVTTDCQDASRAASTRTRTGVSSRDRRWSRRRAIIAAPRPYAPDRLIQQTAGSLRQSDIDFAHLVQHVAWWTAGPEPAAQIGMRDGRSLTEMRLVDGRWYAATVWLR